MSRTALLVIDVQVGFIEGEFSVYEAEAMLARIHKLIQSARAAGVPVIYVQHNSDPEIDGPIHPQIAPGSSEPIVLKMEPDAFHETDLQAVLEESGVTHLVIAGFQTDICINATSRRAQTLEYDVTIVEDAHSTIDGDEEDARTIVANYTGQFRSFAQVIPAADVRFGS